MARPNAVSNSKTASMQSVPARRSRRGCERPAGMWKPDGLVRASVGASAASIAAGPLAVWICQVKASTSRQWPSAAKHAGRRRGVARLQRVAERLQPGERDISRIGTSSSKARSCGQPLLLCQSTRGKEETNHGARQKTFRQGRHRHGRRFRHRRRDGAAVRPARRVSAADRQQHIAGQDDRKGNRLGRRNRELHRPGRAQRRPLERDRRPGREDLGPGRHPVQHRRHFGTRSQAQHPDRPHGGAAARRPDAGALELGDGDQFDRRVPRHQGRGAGHAALPAAARSSTSRRSAASSAATPTPPITPPRARCASSPRRRRSSTPPTRSA